MLLSEFLKRMIGRFSAKWEKIKMCDYADIAALGSGPLTFQTLHLKDTALKVERLFAKESFGELK
jgi:hypothetical protein